MSDDQKQNGRRLALTLVNKINALKKPPGQGSIPAPPGSSIIDATIETSALVGAIEALAKTHVDLSPVVEAIKTMHSNAVDIDLIAEAIKNVEVDLPTIVSQLKAVSERSSTDTKVIEHKLDQIVKAMKENTSVLSELVDVAKADKIVQYDTFGRIIKLGIKK
jgi:hypothetical protein